LKRNKSHLILRDATSRPLKVISENIFVRSHQIESRPLRQRRKLCPTHFSRDENFSALYLRTCLRQWLS